MLEHDGTMESLTSGRQDIHRLLTSGNKAFATIKSTNITNAYNINNARTEDGRMVFFNPAETFGNRLDVEMTTDAEGNTTPQYYQNPKAKPILAIPVGFGGNISIKVVDNTISELEKIKIENDLQEEVSSAIKGKTARYLMGQPVFVILNPATGKYQSIVGSTQNLTDRARDAVLEAITDKDLLKVQEIVGLTYPTVNSAGDTKFFGIAKFTGDPAVGGTPTFFLNDPNLIENVEKWFEDNKEKLQIYFYSKTAAEAVGTSTLIKIDNNNLAAALKGEDFTFTLVEPAAEQGDAGVNIKFVKSSVTDAEIPTLEAVKNNLVSDFKELLMQKKFQVSAERAASNAPFVSPVTGISYNSYQDYLFSQEELQEQGAARGDEGRAGLGHLSVLSTDVKNINGTIFSNPRVNFVDVGTSEAPTSSRAEEEVAQETTDTGENVTEQKEQEAASAAKKASRGRTRGTAPAGPQSGSTTDLSTLVGDDVSQQTTENTAKEAMYTQALEDLEAVLTEGDKATLREKLNDPNVTPDEYSDIIDQLSCPF